MLGRWTIGSVAVCGACLPTVAMEPQPIDALGAVVRVEFDAYDVPLIRAERFDDGAVALGYLHAQERLVQMDLIRRRASGRLSEIVGPDTIGSDRAVRVYGFEGVAAEVVASLPERHRRLLEAYRDGVNAGIAAMAAPPLEYTLLGVAPEPWRLEDSILVMLDMTLLLRSGDQEDRVLAGMRDALAPEMVEFLAPRATRFDAPLDAPTDDPTGGYRPVAVPGPEVFAVSAVDSSAIELVRVESELAVLGSNSWAVAGSRTAHGGAVVSNDMHLPLMLPNIWYRAAIAWEDGAGHARMVAGVSLPGLPGVVAGSSDSLAWGFTNLTADLVDLVPIEPLADDPTRYRYGDGSEAFGARVEVIEVKGGEPIEFEVQTTRWGPVTDIGPDGGPLAMRWGALDASNTNLRLLDLPLARSLEDGLQVARSWLGPAQNIVMADARGDIAWTIGGFLPKREGFAGGLDEGWANGTTRWLGNREGEDRPQLVRPDSGVLFTANNRVVSLRNGASELGRDFALGVRAQRIRELFGEADQWTEREVFDVALDTRSALLDPYREHLLASMPNAADDELVDRALEIVRGWNGTSDADQAAFRLLRAFRSRLQQTVLSPLLAPAAADGQEWVYVSFSGDEPVLRLLEERPEHLLDPRYADWDDLVRRVFVGMVRDFGPGGDGGIETPWGERNQSRVAHPFADMAPAPMRRMLEIPPASQSGDTSSVRVARPTFGASERFAISPGRLEEGLIHMPGGQSGKPLSPHFRDQHGAWDSGEPLPLLPVEVRRVLELRPAEASKSAE